MTKRGPIALLMNVNFFAEKDNDEQKSGKPVDIVSAAIMAKILEEREKERQNVKHCNTCICPLQRVFTDQTTQTDETFRFFIDNNEIFSSVKNQIVKVESYQSQSPSVSSAILIERSSVPVCNNNSNNNNVNNTTVPQKKNDVLKLNVGRNRYHSSKLSRGVNRGLYSSFRKEKSDDVVRNSEVHLDGSVRFSDTSKAVNSKDVAIEIEPEVEKAKHGPRRCSVSVQLGSSNILLDNATCYSSAVTHPTHPYALVHSARSRSMSDSASSNDECSETRPTETQI